MRRNSGKRTNNNKNVSDKIIMYAGIGITVLAVVVFGLLLYSKSLSEEVKDSSLSSEQIASIMNTTQNTQSASTTIGKSVEESANNTTEAALNTVTTNTMNSSNTSSNTASNTTSNINKSTNSNSNAATNITKSNNTTQNTVATTTGANQETAKKGLSFVKPVEGEVVRDFAKDNLIYSETLKEWVTHMGIDIKADKTTVVKSAEAGTVKSIKNDPRYGLTVVIEHEDGYKTVYSNLLTSEFIVEGEKIEKDQAIGTVGNTAVFEISDESHLHFEILKDDEQIDPSIYIK